MGLKKVIFGSLLLVGLAGIVGSFLKEDNTRTINQRFEKATIEKPGKNMYRYQVENDPAPIFPSIIGIYSFPDEQAGVSAEINANAQDCGKNKGITRMVLYEDGLEVSSTDNDSLSVPINHNQPGIHVYEVEAIDRGGNRTRSQKIKLNFSGTPIDSPPKFPQDLGLCVDDCGRLHIFVSDEGDNQGLKEVFLYEDGKVLKRFNPKEERFDTSIELGSLNREGTHSYSARATDFGGNSSTSETIIIDYVGR